ncbi:unnamed protein product [Rhizophagus irregularis]|nr:unnamed protein product [Rhizophagus irregularis]
MRKLLFPKSSSMLVMCYLADLTRLMIGMSIILAKINVNFGQNDRHFKDTGAVMSGRNQPNLAIKVPGKGVTALPFISRPMKIMINQQMKFNEYKLRRATTGKL